jgi:hypothetical protein
MLKKIGEVLIERGQITRSQLGMALRAQLMYGGHLGTCLIELGLVDEDSLGQALAQASGVPYAPPDILQSIPRETIKAFPRKLAEIYEAVPLKILDNTLHLAMIGARNVESIDDIRFAMGYRVEPWIAPEVRIFQALERYYGIPRRARYINLCRALESWAEREVVRTSPTSAPHLQWGASAEAGDQAHSPADGNQAASPGHATDALRDLGGEYGYGRSWKEIAADEVVEKAPPPPPAKAAPNLDPATDAFRKGPEHLTLREVTGLLCQVDGKHQAVDALLRYTSTRMERSLFLVITDDVARVWDSRGSDFDRRRKSQAVFSVSEEKIFELLLGDDYYRGPLPSKASFLNFYKVLGMPAAKEIFLVPIYLDDHLVAVFYGDGGASGTISGDTDDFLRLFRIFSDAVDLIILKDRMRAIGQSSEEHRTAEKSSSRDPANHLASSDTHTRS